MWLFWLAMLVLFVWQLGRKGRKLSSVPAQPDTVGDPGGRHVLVARGSGDDSMRSVEVPLPRGAQSRGYPVPDRPSHRIPLPGGREFTVHVSLDRYGPGAGFLADAERFVARTHAEVPHVPFQTYWSTYRDMSAAQARWYFYWRSQARAGNFLPTDLSYLFIHVYECLHAVGFDDAGAAWRHLVDLWQEYRTKHPKLDYYLQDWVLDMNAYYELGQDPLDFVRDMGQEGVRFRDPDLVATAWLETRDYSALPPEMLDAIARFDRRSGKFYREYPDPALIDRTLQLAVEATDVFFTRTVGQGIFEAHALDQRRSIRRRAFGGAVFDYIARDVEIAQVLQLSESEQLSGLLQGVLKYAENRLRKQVGFNGQRRGVELPGRLEAYLDLVLGSATSRPMAKTFERRTIQIDPAKIEALRKDSEQVRARLEAPELSVEVSQEGYLEVDEAIVETARAATGPASPAALAHSTRFPLPADTPPGQLTDLDKVATVLDNLASEDLALLHELRATGWESGGRPKPEVERVRAASEHVLGDPLIAHEHDRLVVVDDYRDELEFLLARPEYAAPTPEVHADVSSMFEQHEPVWSGLRRALTPLQAQALAMVVAGCTQEEMDRFAADQGTMGALLLDAINERALDVIGDAVVDNYEDPLTIYEEHRGALRDQFGA